MVPSLLLGAGIGLLAAAPLAWLWTRRSARRARLLESRTRQAERLAELGTLTGGLAHEIRNPLATVRLNLQLLADQWEHGQDQPFEELRRRGLNKLAILRRETDRLDDILEDFLRYAGHHELRIAPADLNAVIQELVEFFAPQATASHIRIRLGLAEAPLTVRIDETLFKQALLNLLINAQQAMAEQGGGELIVRTHADDSAVSVEVADTGPGIEPDRLDKIFQAYYSTKRGGTGLGLPTARRIVEEHGGQIHVDSEIGRGTRFVLKLPRPN